MNASETFFLAKIAASNLKQTALPGSTWSKHLDWHAKTFKAVKKKPVLDPGKDKPSLGVVTPKFQ